jgi:hypothetical protein
MVVPDYLFQKTCSCPHHRSPRRVCGAVRRVFGGRFGRLVTSWATLFINTADISVEGKNKSRGCVATGTPRMGLSHLWQKHPRTTEGIYTSVLLDRLLDKIQGGIPHDHREFPLLLFFTIDSSFTFGSGIQSFVSVVGVVIDIYISWYM